jgi:hypothetical protein
MRKPHPKKKHYEQLMFKMTMAIQSEHYLEASWFVYSLLEDRKVAALKASGGAETKKGEPIRMLGAKIDLLSKRGKRDRLLRAYFDSTLIDSMVRWKDRRNRLMHALADGRTSHAKVGKESYLLAIDGKELIKPVCRAVRLLKRNRHQVAIPS